VKLAKINTLLLLGIVIVNGYIIVMPFVPGILFRVQQQQGVEKQFQRALSTSTSSSIAISGDRLVIPVMLLNTPINEGATQSVLSKGLWRLPSSSTPTRGGNMVIVGHRFTYTNPEGVFYNLDKVQVGNDIGVFWQGKRYLYNVVKTEVVVPTDVSVQAPTHQPELTLYTCTPLWLPKNRLVVIAKLESAS
jgi:LPXTG-site transpeptidase (sortase) family protein